MLVNFDSLWICLHNGGSICLVNRIRSTSIFGPGDRFIGPPDPRIALGGIESNVTPDDSI